MKNYEELFAISDELQSLSDMSKRPDIKAPIDALTRIITRLSKAFSGSWIGYHANVYYANLQSPPPGAHFSQEWGLDGDEFIGLGSKGDWREFDPDFIKDYILQQAEVSSVDEIIALAQPFVDRFNARKSDIVSILLEEHSVSADSFLEKLLEEINTLELMTPVAALKAMRPSGQFMTRDSTALGQGMRVPPHCNVMASVASIAVTFELHKNLSSIARKAASHLERKSKRIVNSSRVGTNVFIGHGRSDAWRQLKDFLQDRLRLPWDEFNRIPVAGITNISRLSEMLEASTIAFLIMTAEDELTDGNMQARMNVIHEAGLFQGRLGFNRAIVLLEEGCLEFSNIAGLGQLRFPKGRIDSAFEQVRQVLEREGILKV